MECGNFSNLGPSYKCIWRSSLGWHPLVHLVVLITNDCIAQSCYSLLPDVSTPQDFSMLTTPPHSPAQPVGGTGQRLHTMAESSSKCVSTDFCKVTPELLFFHFSVPHSYFGAAVIKGQI